MKLCECGCGKEVKLLFSRFCQGHSLRNKEVQKKFKQTCLERCGFENPSQSEEVKQRKIESNLDHRGVEYPMQSKEVQKQYKQNYKEKYNVEYSFQLEEVKEKIKKSNIKKYGEDNWAKTPQGRMCSRKNFIRMRDNQITNGEPAYVRIGDQERPFLNELQKHTNYNIIRNDSSFRYIVARYPDGHILEVKLFIQFDEQWHTRECYKQNDIQCTKDLESISGYRVFRVSEKQWKENQEKVISDFKEVVNACSSR